MEVIRYGNDINVTWSVFGRNGSKYSLSDKVRHLWLVNGPRKKEITSYSVQGRNQLVFVIDDAEINRLGVYKLVLQIREPDSVIEDSAYDLTQVFQVVSETYPLHTNTAIDGQCDVSFKSILKNTYISELEGESAYEIAVRHGFEGSEEDWLESLVGIRSVEQSESSQASGGRNIIAFTLADGTVTEVSVCNGAAGERGSDTLSGLSDTAISSPVNGQYLKWNGSRWVNASGADYTYGAGIKITGNVISADIQGIASGLIAAGYSLSGGEGGQSGVTALRALSDVSLTSPVDGQVLAYDASISKWVAKTISSGGDSGGGGGGGDIDPSVLSNYVTIAGSETITGAKTFTAQTVLTDTLIVGSGAATLGPSEVGAKKRIYFGDADHYLELNSNGYYFYGGGVYTNGFMSAGGLSSGGEGGGGGGGATDLNGLTDVSIVSPVDGQVLKYASGGWVNAQLALGDLSNVDLETAVPQDGQVLTYDSANQAWKPMTVSSSSSGGGGVFYGTCATNQSTLAKVVICPEFTAADLKAGTVIFVLANGWNDSTNTSSSYVSLNVKAGTASGDYATGAIRVYVSNDNIVAWDAGEILMLTYTGSNWRLSPTYRYIKNYAGGSGGGSGSSYTLPAATSGALGGIKIGYTQSGKNYPVQLNSNNQAYVNVPWSSGSGGSTVSVSRDQTSGDKVAVLTIDGSATQLYSKPFTGGTVTSSIIPNTTDAIDLGSSTKLWRYLYAKRIYLSSNVYIEADSSGHLHTNAPIVSDSYISAGGVSTT